MINDLQPYLAMKDSGVEWLGEVPQHWTVRRLKANVTNVIDQTRNRLDGDMYVALEHVESWTGRIRDAGAETVFDSQVKRFRAGDVLFGKLRPYLAKVARPNKSGVCVGEFLVLRPRDREQDGGYLEQYLRSKPVIDVINASTFGAKMPRADWKYIGCLAQLLPPSSEQTAIVRYLDHVDRRARRLLSAKRKMIALLTEQKQAIIHRAITGGLDPDAPLKGTGDDWIGAVPEHWGFERGKFYFREVDVRSKTGEEELLSVSRITGVTPRSQKNITMFKAESYVGSKLCTPGQIAVNTMWAWMAAIGVSRHYGIISPSYHTYEQLGPAKFSDEFLDLLLRSDVYKRLYRVNSSGITTSRLRLYPNAFLNIRFLCPPSDEQDAILNWYRTATADIDKGIARAGREIELLNEYVAGLIADVVTGKFDVRVPAAALPDVDPLDTEVDTDDVLDVALEEMEANPGEAEA